MEMILIALIGVLSIIVFLQYNQKVSTARDLKYMAQKIEEIIAEDSIERVKIVTANKEVKQLLSNINELLDYNQQNRMKYNKTKYSMKKMLSNISHDLKTPLTVILGYAEILQATDTKKEMANKIYLKASEVLELMNKFFDLAKLESGDKQFPLSKVNIGEICKITLLEFYDSLCKEEIEVEVNIPENNIYVLGNEEGIRRILNNLLSNAIKYGKNGSFLGVAVKEEGDFVRIEVIDKGKGIEEKYKEEVFERIFTLEDSRSKSYQGSGLGLTITKHLVETLGGEIYLQSTPYEKTVFSFILHKIKY